MVGHQIITREYNNYSEKLRSSLRQLQPGEVVKVKLSDSSYATVKETRFASMDSASPIPGAVNMSQKKVGIVYIGSSPWTVMDGTNMIIVGFLRTIDQNGKPVWRSRGFYDGEMVFYGDRMEDVVDFLALQLHPQIKKEGKPGPFKFYIDNPEETSDNSLRKIQWRTAIQNAVLGVSDEQLKRLALVQVYGRSMFNKPTHNTTKSMRGYIASLLTNDAGYAHVEKVFRSLKETEDIDMIIKALSGGKLILSETNLKRNDNHTLASFTTPITGSIEDKAIEIYGMFKANPTWNQEILEWLREEYSKTPAAAKRTRGGAASTTSVTEED